MKNDKQLTVWGAKDEVIHTQYGSVTYYGWCLFEILRMAAHGTKVRLITNSQKQIALTR